MAQDAKLERYELFTAAGITAAHANSAGEGFRCRDVKFLIELFSNWVESSSEDAVINIQNTQVTRYLKSLVQEGFARRTTRNKVPFFFLTRIGLLELISRIVSVPYTQKRGQFFFLYNFIHSYQGKLTEMVQAEGRQFPIALKLELESLLDTTALLQREISSTEIAVKKLEIRIRDTKKASMIVRSALQRGRDFSEVLSEIEKSYPYELNSQKPLSELILSVPENLRQWELEEGNMLRVQHIHTPSLRMLKAYLGELKSLITQQEQAS